MKQTYVCALRNEFAIRIKKKSRRKRKRVRGETEGEREAERSYARDLLEGNTNRLSLRLNGSFHLALAFPRRSGNLVSHLVRSPACLHEDKTFFPSLSLLFLFVTRHLLVYHEAVTGTA